MAEPTLEPLENLARDIGELIGDTMPLGVGFCLALFDFGDEPGGWFTYVSNAQRDDMVRALKELLERLAGGAACPKCGHGTRVTSKRWAKCKKCGERVRRRADEEVSALLREGEET